jgi:nicotinate-nucleotide pyrophosphorylase (carboxylating)
MMTLLAAELRDLAERALREDVGEGDLTARVSVPADRRGAARIVAKAAGVLAGAEVARACFLAADPAAQVEGERDGARAKPGDVVMRIRGDARALLLAERTALNFMQRLSGIATATAALVAAVAGTRARILDTRKTTPLLRALEKAAVLAGGGENHRAGLFDQVLLKANHFALAAPRSYEDVVRQAVQGAADAGNRRDVIAEARDLDEARAAVRGGAGVVLLDNFRPGAELAAAVAAVRREAAAAGRRVEVEASGGVTAENVRQFAESGVDRISVGGLTHTVAALDLSMQMEATR